MEMVDAQVSIETCEASRKGGGEFLACCDGDRGRLGWRMTLYRDILGGQW